MQNKVVANVKKRTTVIKKRRGVRSSSATVNNSSRHQQQTLEAALARAKKIADDQQTASRTSDMEQQPSCSSSLQTIDVDDTDFTGPPPLKRLVKCHPSTAPILGALHNFPQDIDFGPLEMPQSSAFGGGAAASDAGGGEQQQLSISLSKFRGNFRCTIPSISMKDQENVSNFGELVTPAGAFIRASPPSDAETLTLRSDLPSSLPDLSWGKPERVWNLMCWKETIYHRDPQLFRRHPEIEPRMRSILLDWLGEVCEVHNLHRETYHLAIDFVDRFLSIYRHDNSSDEHRRFNGGITMGIMKTQLQLVGVTALFIAAKLEEIYPPKVAEFAYVTDGACTEQEIIDTEVLILEMLKWQLCPVTVVHWLTVYLQLMSEIEKTQTVDGSIIPRDQISQKHRADKFHLPSYQTDHFLQLCQLVDLCLLDAASMRFSYGVIAAAAIYSLFEPAEITFQVSGYTLSDLSSCLAFMHPFAETIRNKGEATLRHFNDVPDDDTHNIQTHEVDLDLLEKVKRLQLSANYKTPQPPPSAPPVSAVLTPPGSSTERPPHFNYVPPAFYIGDSSA